MTGVFGLSAIQTNSNLKSNSHANRIKNTD